MPEREIGQVAESEIVRGGQEVQPEGEGKLKIGEVNKEELLLEPESHHLEASAIKVEGVPADQIVHEAKEEALHKEGSGSYEIGQIDPNQLLTDSAEHNPDNYKAA